MTGQDPVWVEAAGVRLAADLAMPAGVRAAADRHVPAKPAGVVVFAHGSGSSRLSPRNRLVAARLNEHGLATVLADLLVPDEEQRDATNPKAGASAPAPPLAPGTGQRAGELRFDIGLLADRMTALIDWATATEPVRDQPVGLFGASTGAAAALVAAARRPAAVRAVVSRGGRPDLASEALPRVRAPVLLIVGEQDEQVGRLNEQAASALTAPYRIHVVPGATHLFEEPGALSEVADQAAAWFQTHLRAG